MQYVDSSGKVYYAPIKSNQNLKRLGENSKYQAVSDIKFSDEELKNGIEAHIKNFAKARRVTIIQNYCFY